MQKRAAAQARRSHDTTGAIDIHAHYVPEEYLRLIEAEGELHGVRLRPGPNGPLIVSGQVAIGPITAHYHDLDLRLRTMDAQGVAVHALSLMPPMVYWADGALGLRLARLVNDAMAEASRSHRDRFVALATLPMQDPEAAVSEVDRAVTQLGSRGIYLGTNVRGKELSDLSSSRSLSDRPDNTAQRAGASGEGNQVTEIKATDGARIELNVQFSFH